VFSFRIQSYASTGHLKTGPFEIGTDLSGFQMVASLDHFINKRAIKNILFMQNGLGQTKYPVRFSNGKNKMAAKTRWPTI
jgi:hypothetical protein